MLAGACKERRRDSKTESHSSAQPALAERIDAAIERGAEYLRGRQRDDGSFRGELYAAFRGGRELTPLAGLALALSGGGTPDTSAARRAATFVASADSPLAYPVYDLAGAGLLLNLYDDPEMRSARDAAIDALRKYQLGAANGWGAEDLSTGGWSYADDVPAKPPAGSRVNPRLESNMSATVFAIGAIALSRHAPFEDRALRLARSFVERCQNYDPAEPTSGDGGFFFSPSVSDSNKAGAKAGRYTSYGSATADGVRALVRLGADAGDPRVRAARAWLLRHFDPGKNPGDFPPTHEIRRASSYYYYVWSVAHAMRLLGETEWAPALAEALLERQREDGSWANPAGEMREDEPVVATSFSMAALSVTRLVLRAEYRSHRARE